MKKEVMQKWVKALRSGKYRQISRILNDDNGGYCCLGVLCQLASNEKVVPKKSWSEGGILTERVMNWADMKTQRGDIFFKNGKRLSLSFLNDSRHRSFKQIAAFIERNWKRL